MPRELLGDVVNPSAKVGTKKWRMVPVSIAGHLCLLGLVLAGPVVSGDVLPLPRLVPVMTVPLPRPAPPESRPVMRAPEAPQPLDVIDDAAPIEMPSKLSPEPSPDRPRRLGEVNIIGTESPAIGSGPAVLLSEPPPPPPTTPVRVGGVIQPPKLLKRVDPVYPALARNARLHGYVIVEATIARDGAVRDVRLLKSSHAVLDKAALEAVGLWTYTPTMLNGEAVEVLLNVTVTFTLR